MVTPSARDSARTRPYFVGWICHGCGGTSVGYQPGGGHTMASSIFTQWAIQDLHDYDLITVRFTLFFSIL
jgi:hypothetical protein